MRSGVEASNSKSVSCLPESGRQETQLRIQIRSGGVQMGTGPHRAQGQISPDGEAGGGVEALHWEDPRQDALDQRPVWDMGPSTMLEA